MSDATIISTKYNLGLTYLTGKGQKLRAATEAHFNKKFVAQNKGFFGFVPLSKLPDKIPDLSKRTDLDYLNIHARVKRDGRKNCMGLQIPIKSQINFEKCQYYLRDYWNAHQI